MSEKITKSARFTPEWAARIDLMADLDVEMPDGVTSVLQEGAEMAWAKYGKLAEVMADAKARAREETTVDRTAEVNAIRELAANIACNLGEGTAEELVEYALSDEGRESWGIDIELDDHDRRLLVRFVEDNLSDED